MHDWVNASFHVSPYPEAVGWWTRSILSPGFWRNVEFAPDLVGLLQSWWFNADDELRLLITYFVASHAERIRGSVAFLYEVARNDTQFGCHAAFSLSQRGFHEEIPMIFDQMNRFPARHQRLLWTRFLREKVSDISQDYLRSLGIPISPPPSGSAVAGEEKSEYFDLLLKYSTHARAGNREAIMWLVEQIRLIQPEKAGMVADAVVLSGQKQLAPYLLSWLRISENTAIGGCFRDGDLSMKGLAMWTLHDLGVIPALVDNAPAPAPPVKGAAAPPTHLPPVAGFVYFDSPEYCKNTNRKGPSDFGYSLPGYHQSPCTYRSFEPSARELQHARSTLAP